MASAQDPTGQTSTVLDVVLSVDLKMVKSGMKVTNVCPTYLVDIHPFMIGRHVTRKNPPHSVGTIDDVLCDVEVRFNDRTKCIVHEAII